MRALIGMVIGAAVGWFIGYAIVVSRFDDAPELAQVVGYSLAPTAPDTILATFLGALVGLVAGLLCRRPSGDLKEQAPRGLSREEKPRLPEAMDMRKLGAAAKGETPGKYDARRREEEAQRREEEARRGEEAEEHRRFQEAKRRSLGAFSGD